MDSTDGKAEETPHPSPPPQGGRESSAHPDKPNFPHSLVPPLQREHARKMRRLPTDAEKLMWRELRGNRLDGFAFRRQVPMGRFIADFVCHEAGLVVELDGEAHRDPARDAARDAWFRSRSYRTLRLRNEEALGETARVLAQIRRALRAGADPPEGVAATPGCAGRRRC